MRLKHLSTTKTLEKSPKNIRLKAIGAIDLFAINPKPPKSKKLIDRKENRIQVRGYRIPYEINGNKLLTILVKIGHRNNVYDD